MNFGEGVKLCENQEMGNPNSNLFLFKYIAIMWGNLFTIPSI